MPQFKARPAKVLEKKPFIPTKAERPVVEVKNFMLNTNKRAKEREEFEQKLKERELIVEETKKQVKHVNNAEFSFILQSYNTLRVLMLFMIPNIFANRKENYYKCTPK